MLDTLAAGRERRQPARRRWSVELMEDLLTFLQRQTKRGERRLTTVYVGDFVDLFRPVVCDSN